MKKNEPYFTNRPNWQFHCGGISHWISRSVAVDGFLWFYSEVIENPELHILTIQRSDDAEDEPGKICCPCGYLDWDEHGFDAMVREVYEETSLYLHDIEEYYITVNKRQPFYTETDPKLSKRQNVCLYYTGFFNLHENPLPDIESFTSSETKKVRFMRWSDFQKTEKDRTDWAFIHNMRIQQSYEFLVNKGVL